MYTEIWVDFFRKSGKWYSGGLVDVGDVGGFLNRDAKQLIVDNQKVMGEGWQGDYIVVTQDIEKNFNNEDYAGFCKAVFQADEFIGIKKTGS